MNTTTEIDQTINRLMALPSRSREKWRAAAAVWMNINPENMADAIAVAEYCKEERASREHQVAMGNSGAKFGLSKDSNSALRSPLSMPAGMLSFIEVADPGLLDPDEAKVNLRKLAKAFPEFSPVPHV